VVVLVAGASDSLVPEQLMLVGVQNESQHNRLVKLVLGSVCKVTLKRCLLLWTLGQVRQFHNSHSVKQQLTVMERTSGTEIVTQPAPSTYSPGDNSYGSSLF
jgi:hypothetical protein